MKRVHWKCPAGKHPGVLGSTRPRKDDLVRFCLACSVEQGKLIKRFAPALVRERTVRIQLNKEHAVRVRVREKQAADAQVSAFGMNMLEELTRLLRVAHENVPPHLIRTFTAPKLHIRRASAHPRKRLGVYRSARHEVSVTTFPSQRKEDFLETLAHEVAHAVVGWSGEEGWHGDKWRTAFRIILKHAYGVETTIEHRRHAGHLREKLDRANEQEEVGT